MACRPEKIVTRKFVSIRDVEPSDYDAVHALNESGVPNVNSVPFESIERFAATAAYFRIVEDDEGIAAFMIGLTPDADYESPNFQYFRSNFDDFVYVDRIVVAGRARRRGIARALYNDFERFGRSREAARFCAEVNVRPRNDVSLEFHERFGFREVGQQDTEGGSKRVSLLVKTIKY